jgi:hypothetical protein
MVPTINNQKTVFTILSELKKVSKDYVVVDTGIDYQNYPMISICLKSSQYLVWLTKKYKQCGDFEKRIILFNLSSFVFSPGVTWFYKKTLMEYRPECIILANDHMYYCKSLELVCEDYGIRTIYVQHASVSYAFPELHFTYSFLDGVDSLMKYSDGNKTCRGDVFLLGALRYDSLSKYRVTRNDNRRNRIGVAINDLDDNNVVNYFCNKLLERYPGLDLVIRSHPAMKNRPFAFDAKDRIEYKCATEESIVDYLDKIDIQISGDSGVHFDAIIGGVPTFAFNFTTSSFEDNYGYVKKGLIKYAKTIEVALNLLQCNDLEPPRELIEYYDASFGKTYAGKCAGIVSEFIINGYSIDFLASKYGVEQRRKDGLVYYIFPE